MAQFFWWRAAAVILCGLVALPSTAVAQSVDITKVSKKVVIPAGTAWDSPVRYGEVCSFDLAVKYDEVFEVTTFPTYQVLHIVINDEFKNRSTGFVFFDTADYYIRYEFESGIAFHAGTFWLTKAWIHNRLRDVVRDIGTFYQNWNNPDWLPVFDLTGPEHDVNSLPFGTLSYCDWAQGIFPR
jgi:hypothetical protein